MCRKTTVFVGGLVIGATLGVLYAPQKGEETREEAKEIAKKCERKLRKVSKKAKRRIREIKDYEVL